MVRNAQMRYEMYFKIPFPAAAQKQGGPAGRPVQCCLINLSMKYSAAPISVEWERYRQMDRYGSRT